MAPKIPVSELNSAIESAIQKALGQHGGPSVDQLWVGFVAPEQFANMDIATKVASQITQATGIQGTPAVAQLGTAAGGGGAHADALTKPGHILGIIYKPALGK